MQVDFLNPVLYACENVMIKMADLSIVAGKPKLKKSATAEVGATVTGIISMRGGDRCASIAIIFKDTVLSKIALKMLPDDVQQGEYMAFDLVGEISNMIIGGAKTQLLKEGYDFELSLPTVISGYDYLIAHQTKTPILRIPLMSDVGTFHVEASFEGLPLTEKEKMNNPHHRKMKTNPMWSSFNMYILVFFKLISLPLLVFWWWSLLFLSFHQWS